MSEPDQKRTDRLVSVVLDEASIGRSTADKEHERQIAIYDLLEENSFSLPGHNAGPYGLKIVHILSLTPLRGLLKDYFFICETYYAAIRTAMPNQIEAIDMGRRALHNEAAQLLLDRLKGKIDFDIDTARRIFTLVAALHWKG
jgi:uncharacterized protein (UPF0262 family)